MVDIDLLRLVSIDVVPLLPKETLQRKKTGERFQSAFSFNSSLKKKGHISGISLKAQAALINHASYCRYS